MRLYPLVVFLTFTLSTHATQPGPEKLCPGRRPTFSPDGKVLLYELDNKIYTINLVTKKRKLICDFVESAKPRWSPDGKKIIFQSHGPKGKQTTCTIWIANADGTNKRELIKPSFEANHTPSISPDGKKLVWSRGKQLWLANSDGQNAHQLTHTSNQFQEWPRDWSPDGSRIVFCRLLLSGSFDTNRLWFVDTTGRNQRVFRENYSDEHARWSKDGLSLYVIRGHEISKINLSTLVETTVCSSINDDIIAECDISPDEKYIAFEAFQPEVDENIFIQLLPSKNQQQ